MAKIVVLELGFEDDDDAEEFADGIQKHVPVNEMSGGCDQYDVIECRVENP
jgi:hypothetical protein